MAVKLYKKHRAFAAATAVAACIAFAGCTGEEPAQISLELPPECVVQITKGKDNFSAVFERNEDGVWTACFSQPETISEMTVKAFGDSYAVEFMGLSHEMTADNVPIGSVTSMVTSCLDHAAGASSVKCVKDGKDCLVSGEASCGSYVLRVDSDGKIVSLTVGNDFRADFSHSGNF